MVTNTILMKASIRFPIID